MNLPPSQHDLRSSADELAKCWANRIIVLSVVLILVATLYPFRLRVPDALSIRQTIRGFMLTDTNWSDLIANVVLFIPLGFGSSAGLSKHKLSDQQKLLIVLGCSAGLSLTVEILQVFLNNRTPALTDLVTNTLGGYLGYLTFQYGRSPLLGFIQLILIYFQRFVSRLSWIQVSVTFLIYVVLAISLVGWLNGSTLRSWDLNARLLIGSDIAHRMHWEGTIANVQICDRALSANDLTAFLTQAESTLPCHEHLVTAYPLTRGSGLADRTGQSPDLVWHGSDPTPTALSDQGAVITAQRWLETNGPTTQINQRIQASSELTLAAVVTAAQPELPPRWHQMIALASHPALKNFTLTQVRSDLLFWINTRLHGSGQSPPQGGQEQALAGPNPHRLVITYSGLALRAYVDNPETPTLFLLTPVDYQVISYLFVFVPIGILLRLIVNYGKGQFWLRLVLTGVGCVLPPLVLESVLAHQSDRPIRLANLLLSIVIVSATFWLARGRSTRITPMASEMRAGE
ncbi:VanZ family protein [Pantanalinema sp. GBBB05]|uniref:VanZ family protein n=1 Tax=Pantanalinema sp. GBBB05 TaxID=2604139 RepID=UPI001DC8E278|nr:VanZ family protein [Pantanalinema sp. GBBB05]